MSISPISHSYLNFSFDGARSEAAAALDVAQDNLLPSQGIADYLAPFKTVGLFNTQTAEEASIFLLGELHNDPTRQSSQANLIEFLASQGPVIVLVEGRESGMLRSFARTLASGAIDGNKYSIHEFMTNVCVTQMCRNQQNISVMGWDSPIGIVKSAGYFPDTIAMLEAIASKIDERIQFLFDQICAELPQCKKILMDVMQALPPEEMVYRMAESPNVMYLEIIKKLGALFSAKKIVSLESIPLHLIQDLVIECRAASLYEIEMEEGSKHSVTETSVSKTFPARTASMVSTLRQLAGIKLSMGAENAKVVLIAGSDHLITSSYDEEDPNVDLSTLYSELEYGNHKAVILVSPHVLDWKDRFGREHLAARGGSEEQKQE